MTVYTADYFLSDACEGLDAYLNGTISLVKQRELDLLDPQPGDRILDLGCGRGEVVAHLIRDGYEVIGIDYSGDALHLSRELLEREDLPVHLARCDAARLPFADGSFDRILMGDVIEHLEWEHGEAALREIGRILAPGGTVLVHTAPNLWFVRLVLPIVRLLLKFFGQRDLVKRIDEYNERRAEVHPNELSILGLKRIVRNSGLNGRVWIDPDVLRSGASTWTESIGGGIVGRVIGAIAGAMPFRWLLGNDLYALVGPPTTES